MVLTVSSEGLGVYSNKIIVQRFLKHIDANTEFKWYVPENRKLPTETEANVTITRTAPDVDIIVSSVFTQRWNEPRWNQKSKKYIYWSGEPEIPGMSVKHTEFLFFLTHRPPPDFKYPYLHLPFVLFSPFLYKNRLGNNNPKYLLAYCNSNTIEYRELVYDKFVAASPKGSCGALGKCCGSHPETQKEIPGRWESEILIDEYRNYKFVLAMENVTLEGYVTEKIVNAFRSGAVPIYWGAREAKQMFNPKAFVNMNDFASEDECIKYVVTMPETTRLEMLAQPIYTDNPVINLLRPNSLLYKEYVEKIKHTLKLP